MSKRRDPVADAVDYVMTAPLAEASGFVRTLTHVLTSRARQAQTTPAAPKRDKPAMAKATSTSTTRSRAALREVKVTDPNMPEATTPSGDAAAQPANVEDQLALT